MKRSAIWSRIKTYVASLIKTSDDTLSAVGPYWGLTASLERVRDQAHWCGVGRWNRERWLAYGDFFDGFIGRCLERHVPRPALSQKTALDWGCGGGAVTRVLCRRFHMVWGVEIGEATLGECRRRMAELHLNNFRGLLVPAEEPERAVAAVGAGKVDFILSVAVFKHFPSAEYTLRILKVFSELIVPGGFLFIQYRYDDGTPKYRPKTVDYARNVVTMTSLTLETFSAYAQQADLQIVHTERDTDGDDEHHQYALLTKPSFHQVQEYVAAPSPPFSHEVRPGLRGNCLTPLVLLQGKN